MSKFYVTGMSDSRKKEVHIQGQQWCRATAQSYDGSVAVVLEYQRPLSKGGRQPAELIVAIGITPDVSIPIPREVWRGTIAELQELLTSAR